MLLHREHGTEFTVLTDCHQVPVVHAARVLPQAAVDGVVHLVEEVLIQDLTGHTHSSATVVFSPRRLPRAAARSWSPADCEVIRFRELDITSRRQLRDMPDLVPVHRRVGEGAT